MLRLGAAMKDVPIDGRGLKPILQLRPLRALGVARHDPSWLPAQPDFVVAAFLRRAQWFR